MTRAFFFLILLIPTSNSFAQKESNDTVRYETKKIYDPLTQNFLLYTRMDYAYLVPEKYGSMGVIKQWSLPVILKATQDTHLKKINQRMKAILCEQPDTEVFTETITLHCKQSLATYVYVYSNLKDTLGVFRDENAKAKFVNSKFSITYSGKSIVTLVAMFNYRTKIPGVDYYGSPLQFENTYYQTYYFDLATGKEYSQKDVFKSSSLPEVERKASELVNEKKRRDTTTINEIHFYGQSEWDDDDSHAVHRLLNSRNKKLKDFSLLRDGIVFPQAVSFTYTIPANTPCTQNMFGFQTSVRIPFEKVKMHLNPQGPFAYFIDSLPPPNKTLKNYLNPNPAVRYNLGIDAFENMEDPLKPFKMKKVKKMSIYQHHTTTSGKGSIEHTNLYLENFYLKNGLLSKVLYYDDISFHGVHTYSLFYDDRKNLIRFTALTPDHQVEDWRFQYDDANNLTVSSYYNSEPSETYTYFDGFFVREINEPGMEAHFNRFNVNNRGGVFEAPTNTIIEYDSLGRVTAEYREAYPIEDYDMDGNVISSFLHGDRSEGNFYTYDAAGDLVKVVQRGYEYQFLYDQHHRLVEERRSSYEYNFPYYTKQIIYDKQSRPYRVNIQNHKSGDTRYTFTFKYVEW